QFVVPPEGISFKDVITDFEKRLIESTLEAAGGVQKRAAELLHIKPTTLNEMIKRYDIRPRRKRATNGAEQLAHAAAPEGPPRERAGRRRGARDTPRIRRDRHRTVRRCCASSARPAPGCARWPESACRRRTPRAPATKGSRTAMGRRRPSRPRAPAAVRGRTT